MRQILSILILLLGCNDNNYKHISNKNYSQYDSLKIKFLGEVEIKNPIVLRFVEKYDIEKYNYLLISKDSLDLLEKVKDSSFIYILENYGGLMFESERFKYVQEIYKLKYDIWIDSLYNGLSKLLKQSEKDTIWKYTGKTKTIDSWTYNEVHYSKFLHFLVDRKIIWMRTSRDMINTIDTNKKGLISVYLPISWVREK